MQRRKCIGVFLGQPNLPFQAEVLKYIKNYAFAAESNVVVFSAMTYTKGYPDYQHGESQNVSLANFETMDAVIVLPDTLQATPTDQKEVLEFIRNNYQGIRITLDIEAEGYQTFFCDDTDVSAQIVTHLIELHQCTDIAYMTGIKEHPHSHSRLNGYYKALKQHNIDVDESRVFFGDFWYNEGERVVETLCNSKKGLPQAIACANDAMAVSVYKALEARGLHVPEDILVTGFDHSGNASSGDYPITSAKRDVSQMVSRAMCYILNEWGITDMPAFESANCLVINKSCGCNIKHKERYQIDRANMMEGFYSNYNFMLEDMISSKDIQECIWKIDWYAGEQAGFLNNFSHLRLCLCDDWNQLSASEHEGTFTDQVLLALDKRPGDTGNRDIRFGMDVVFPRKDYFPGFGDLNEAPEIFYFNVLHFGQNCFGYLVLSYNSQCSDYVFDNIYVAWVRRVNNSLESLRRQYAVEALYRQAEERAIRDTMTGLYNRNGYNHMFPEMLREIGEKENFIFLFFDNNGLKYINDTYGHVAGDDVICQTADILSTRYFPEARKEYNFRIGGDEYVKLVLGEITEETVKQCVKEIHKKLHHLNEHGGRSYPIYVAAGYQMYTADNIMSPDDIMKSADDQMYENKKLLKEETGFRPVRKNK